MTALHITLAPDYRIVEEGLGWELQYQEPVRGFWVCLFEAPTLALCEKAYLIHNEGEPIPASWEELE